MGNQSTKRSTNDQNIPEKQRFAFNVNKLIKIKKYPIENDYVLIKPPIGQGSFGEVYQIYQRFTKIIRSAKKIKIC